MARPYTDIVKAKNSDPIKNGSAIVSTTFRGKSGILNTTVSNQPTITDIQSKYGNRFYNGILTMSSNPSVVQLSAAEYANLESYNPNTIYYIV